MFIVTDRFHAFKLWKELLLNAELFAYGSHLRPATLKYIYPFCLENKYTN